MSGVKCHAAMNAIRRFLSEKFEWWNVRFAGAEFWRSAALPAIRGSCLLLAFLAWLDESLAELVAPAGSVSLLPAWLFAMLAEPPC